MGDIFFTSTAYIVLALLCPFFSPTPLEKDPAGLLPQTPQVEPRDVVTVTKDTVNSVVQSNPPFYDTACKAGGCTFSYEVSSSTIYVNLAAFSTNDCSLYLFFTSPPQHRTRLASPHSPALRSKPLRRECCSMSTPPTPPLLK